MEEAWFGTGRGTFQILYKSLYFKSAHQQKVRKPLSRQSSWKICCWRHRHYFLVALQYCHRHRIRNRLHCIWDNRLHRRSCWYNCCKILHTYSLYDMQGNFLPGWSHDHLKNDRRNSGCKLQPEWSRIEPIFIWTSHKVFSASFPRQHILDDLFGLVKNTCKLQHAGEYPRPWTVLSPAEATPTVTRRVKRRRRREETAFAIWKQLSAMRSQTMDNAGGK